MQIIEIGCSLFLNSLALILCGDMSMPPRTVLKAIVLGDTGVSKTSLMNQYVHKNFGEQYNATVRPDHWVTKEDLQIDDRLVTLQAIPQDPDKFPFILLGNKIDIDGGNCRVVSEKKAKEWCAAKGNIPYFETSAKEDHNLDAAFLSIARAAMTNQDEIYLGVPEAVPETDQRGDGCVS